MKFSGTFKGKITNYRTGEIICWEKHNKVVKGGFDWLADCMSNVTNRNNAISFIAFGTGDAVTTYNMATLQQEVARYPVTSSWNSETRELSFTGAIPQNSGLGTINITEVGLFNAPQDGVMFDRATFLPKGIEEATGFEYTFVITLSE